MGDPLVTTIIPTYNRARELVLAVESALAQSYPADRQEILVVDDGSHDDGATLAALRPYGSRLRALHKQNGGVSSARNFGMAHARGELFAFLDSDDEWLPEKLRRQVDFLAERPRCAVVLTEFVRLDENRGEAGVMHLAERFADDQPNLVQALRWPGLPPSTVLVRRAVVDEVGGFDTTLRTAEDIDFQLRVARRHGIGLVREPLVRYKMGHPGGLSHGRRTYQDFMRVVRGFLDRHGHELPPGLARRLLYENFLANARGLIRGGWYGDGVALSLQALRYAAALDEVASVGRLGPLLARNALSRACHHLGLLPLAKART